MALRQTPHAHPLSQSVGWQSSGLGGGGLGGGNAGDGGGGVLGERAQQPHVPRHEVAIGKLTVVSHVQLAPLLVAPEQPSPVIWPVSSQLLAAQQLQVPRQLSPIAVPNEQSQLAPLLVSVAHDPPVIKPLSWQSASNTPGARGGWAGDGVTNGGGNGLGGGGDGGGDGGDAGGEGGGGQQPQKSRQFSATSTLTAGSHVHPSTLVTEAQSPPMMYPVSWQIGGGEIGGTGGGAVGGG